MSDFRRGGRITIHPEIHVSWGLVRQVYDFQIWWAELQTYLKSNAHQI
ncbi:MAG: hypothetical protein O3A00_09785 [Planctomycetota bacterium]|nr:hypothetical protein [Planctomycetota bacterium]